MISNPEVNRTLATLRKAEFGFLGVIVEKLTDKFSSLSLYKTVHEICTSYGFSFNSFEVGWIYYFRCSRIFIFPSFMHYVSKSNWNQLSKTRFCIPTKDWWIRSFPVKNIMQNLRDFLFLLYSYPISTASEQILFCINRYYYMLIPSWYLDISFLQIKNWIRNWRVNVSLSMWLYTVRIRTRINFMQNLGSRALVGVVQDHFFRWPMLKGYLYLSIWDMIWSTDCVGLANSNRYGQGKYTEKEVFSDLISQWSGSVSPFSYDEPLNYWHQSYILFL